MNLTPVRAVIVMQRISSARIEAKKEMRKIRDDEVKTACQQVCPAEAIVFGDLRDHTTRARKHSDHLL